MARRTKDGITGGKTGGGLIVFLVACASLLPVHASSDPTIDLYSLVGETMLQSRSGDRVTLAWWIPEEFWRAAFISDELADPEGMEEFLSGVRPYVVIGALEGTFGPEGGSAFSDPGTLRKNVVLRDATGRDYAPLRPDALAADVVLLAAMMRPAAEDLLGPVGEHMEFLYFPAQSAEGAPIADADGNGEFSITVGDAIFEWVLPLDSVLPRKFCIVDGEEMSGDWIYCPWHGIRLSAE